MTYEKLLESLCDERNLSEVRIAAAELRARRLSSDWLASALASPGPDLAALRRRFEAEAELAAEIDRLAGAVAVGPIGRGVALGLLRRLCLKLIEQGVSAQIIEDTLRRHLRDRRASA